MRSWLTPHRLFWGLILALTAAVVGYGCYASRTPPEECNAYCRSIIASHTRQLVADRDRARAVAVAAETVYVVRRVVAKAAVALVAHDTTAKDSLVHLVQAVASQGSALAAADSLLAKFRVERTKSDSVEHDLRRENDMLRHEVQALTPGRFSRGWNAVKVPLAFTAGIALGAYVGSRVIR